MYTEYKYLTENRKRLYNFLVSFLSLPLYISLWYSLLNCTSKSSLIFIFFSSSDTSLLVNSLGSVFAVSFFFSLILAFMSSFSFSKVFVYISFLFISLLESSIAIADITTGKSGNERYSTLRRDDHITKLNVQKTY